MRLRCRLREIREHMPRRDDGKPVTLTDIARRSGVSVGQLSLLERGIALPADSQLAALERAYGATIDTWYAPKVLLVLEEDETDG